MVNTTIVVSNTKTSVVISVMRKWTRCLYRNSNRQVRTVQLFLIVIFPKTRFQASTSQRIKSVSKLDKELNGLFLIPIIILLKNMLCLHAMKSSPCLLF